MDFDYRYPGLLSHVEGEGKWKEETFIWNEIWPYANLSPTQA